MTELTLPYVSVASSGSEYFQVSFADKIDSDDAYFLIQRQFESPDGERFYIESHKRALCGHFRISNALLGREFLQLEIMSQSPQTVHVRFEADNAAYSRLKRVLGTMMPSSVLKIRAIR